MENQQPINAQFEATPSNPTYMSSEITNTENTNTENTNTISSLTNMNSENITTNETKNTTTNSTTLSHLANKERSANLVNLQQGNLLHEYKKEITKLNQQISTLQSQINNPSIANSLQLYV